MPTPALDRDALIELLDGNPQLIITIVDSFLGDCTDYMEAIREAVEAENAQALEQKAHGLKGAAGSLRADPTRQAAETLEEMARAGEFSDAEAALGERLPEGLPVVDVRDADESPAHDDVGVEMGALLGRRLEDEHAAGDALRLYLCRLCDRDAFRIVDGSVHRWFSALVWRAVTRRASGGPSVPTLPYASRLLSINDVWNTP